jgi:soluble lytic murein transglycosylase-like protein
MEMKKTLLGSNQPYKAPVVWRSHHDRVRGKWRSRFVLTNLIYIAAIASLVLLFVHAEKKVQSAFSQKEEFEDLKKREAIYSLLKSKGISLNQGLDLANAIVKQSKELDIPVSMILAVMKKESMFDPRAVSSRNALGLMQVRPVTWKQYAAKLKLDVSTRAAFDPATNVIVATHIIGDLRDSYKKTARSESDLWESVLSAYYAGRASIAQNGINSSHRRYVADVHLFKSEFDRTLAQ